MENYDDFFDRLKNYEYVPPAKAAPAPKKESNWEATKRIAGDLGPSFGAGSGQLVRSVGTLLAGNHSEIAQAGQNAVDYWDDKKSAQLRAAEKELGADMANPGVSAWDVTKKLVTSPTLLTNAIAGSAPSMAVGMGVGGLIARSMAGAGVMIDAAGGLTRAGSAVAGGAGEGAVIAADVYENTQGSGAAGAAGLALGIVTSIVTPGNMGAAAARRITGTTDDAVRTAFNGSTVARAGGAIAAEAGQEYGQEFGQKLIEQKGRGEDFDFNAANKAGAVGAVVGGVMGGGLHPVVGDDTPRYATQADKDVAVAAEVAAIKLGDINKTLEADPNNPVLLAEASLAQATINRAAPAGNTEALIAQQTAAVAQLEAARNPGNRDLDEQAEHATAAAALITAGPGGVGKAADQAHAAAVETIHAAPDMDAALGAFAAGEQASSTLRTTVTGVQNTHSGVAEAAHTFSEESAAADVARWEQEQKAARGAQQHALKTEQQAIKNQTSAVKLQQEIAKARGEEVVQQPGTDGIQVEEGPQTREAVFALWEPAIREAETRVMDIDLPQLVRGEAYAQMKDLQEQRNRAAEGLPNEERMLTGNQVREFMVEPDGITDEFDLTEPEGVSPELAEATRAMVDEGYLQAVIEQQEQAPTSSLRVVMNSLDATYNRRRHAFEVLQTHDEGAGLTRAQFNAREAELDRQLRANLPSTSHGNADTLARQVGSRPLASLRAVATGNQVESGLARVAVAFASGRHLGNIDEVLVVPAATATPGRYSLQTSPDRQTVDVVDDNGDTFDTYRGNSAVQDATATMNRLNERNPAAPAPRTRAQALADEMRSAAAEVEVEPTTSARERVVSGDFRSRARAALANHSLQKLGEFWKTVMAGRGQRVLNVRTQDLANRATSHRDIQQSDLDTLKDRYNTELRRQARAWAKTNNQPEPSTQNPVVSITHNGSSIIIIKVRALGRNRANPYAVTPGGSALAEAYVYMDGHMDTQGLSSAPGSSNLAYRLGAEVARIAGKTVPASSTLLTNNPMRRQMQSVFSDTLFAPGHVSPLSSGGRLTPQGVPSDVWEDAGQVERIGLNALRAAHSASENRLQSDTIAKFIENLMFNSDGQIYAATRPRHYHGFPQGAVVSDAELMQKLLSTGAAGGRAEAGGVGIDTAKFAIMTNTVMSHIEGNRNARIPAWMATKAKQIGREMGGWMFSEGEQTAGQPITREDATARVNALLGDSVGKVMLESGMITFVDTAAELTGETFSDAGGRVRGATSPDGSIVMVLENLAAENFDAVLQHEGLHATLKALVGEETYGKMMNRLDTLLKSGKGADWVAAANARVPANTAEANRLEEVAAYALELPVEESNNPLQQWAKDFMSAIRAAIIKSKRVPEALRVWAIQNLQVQDLRRLAVAGLRSQAITAQEGTRLSAVSIDTPAFKRWFGDSKVVDANGEPLVVYHGTTGNFSAFDTNKIGTNDQGWYGRGVYTGPDSVMANTYANYGNFIRGGSLNDVPEGSNVMPVYVSLQNPYIWPRGRKPAKTKAQLDALMQELTEAGYDGVIKPDFFAQEGDPKFSEIVAFKPEQIKSAIGNNGAFDPNNPDIRRSTGRDYQGEIDSLMAEHALPDTTSERRSEINTELGKLRAAQRVERDGKFERDARLSVEQEIAVSTDPLEQAHPEELNVAGLNWRKPFERAVEMIRSSIQDKHVTLRRIQQIAGVTAERIKIDTIGALDRLGSRLMTKQQDLVKAPLAKIEHLLTSAGFSAEEGRKAIDDYLIALHVAEYNAHIATIYPARYEMKDGVRTYVSGHDAAHPGSGITDEEAKATIQRLTAAPLGSPNYDKVTALLVARRVYRQMITDLQNYAVEQGLEKQSTIDTWNEKFPNYAPFNRDLDLDENLSIGTVPGSQGFSLRTGVARRAMGSSADIISPLASTMLFGLKTTTRGENAEVSRTVLNFAREFVPNYLSSERGPDGTRLWKPMWKVESIPNQRVVKKVNVYQTKMADGEMSPEFYNREQARDYADYQQSLWDEMNPGASPQDSGIRVQQVGDGPQNRVVVQPVPNPNNQGNVMVIPEEGENKIITFDEHSEDAMAILHGLKGTATSGENAKTMARWLTLPRMFSRWVMATSTGFNPVFSLFNAARDVPGAMLSVGSDKIPGWTAADSAKISKNFFAAAGSIWKQKGVEFRALHGNSGAAPAPAAGSYAAWADEMQAYGGATGVRESASDIDEAETQIRRLFGQELIEKTTSPNKAHDWLSKSGGFVVKVGDAFARFGEGETKTLGFGWLSRNIVSATARLNEAAELATRTSVFKAATEKYIAAGHTEVEAKTMAANISKNVSTNFNRRGTASSTINQLFPFFNAAMQGSARLAESLFEKQTYTIDKEGRVAVDQKTKLTPYGKVVIGSLVGLGGLQAALLAMAGFEDDDIQKNVKDRAFIIPLSGGSYVAIPMPHGFNTIVNFGREMADAAINPDKALAHIGSALWQAPAFNPLGSAGNWVTDFLPAIADAPVSLYMNQDAFGRPIAKEDGDKANPTPGFTRAKEGASKTGRVLAEAINTITGGNEDQKGAFSPTPDQIDFALGVAGGGVGRELMKGGQLAGAAVDAVAGNEHEAIPTHKLPLIGRLYGDIKEPVALRGKAFEIRKDLNDNFARYKGLRDRGETEAADAYWNDHPELELRDDFERFSKNDSKQKKSRALARNNDEVSEVNRITNEQDSKVSDLLDRYRELKAK